MVEIKDEWMDTICDFEFILAFSNVAYDLIESVNKIIDKLTELTSITLWFTVII